jgi:ABC-type polysaccharide/polyol phosphate export permease
MAPWTFFSMALSMASTGIVDNTELSSKVYFPRAVLPLAQVGTALYTYAITLAVVVVLCPFLGAGLGPRALLVIPGSALLIGLAVGFCLVNSALHVYFRDIRYAVSAALLVWMYVTPVIYPAADAPHVLRTLLDVNPMTGVVDLFHAGLVGHAGALMIPLLSTAAWIIVLLSAGTALHCRYDRVFADLL